MKLVERAQSGDSEAFANLYREIYQDLYRFALYTLKHPQDAEDVVADTVTDAWKGIRLLRRAESFKAWIFRIMTNKCKIRLKEYMNKTGELSEEVPGQERDLCQDIDVRRAFSALDDGERLIIALHIFGGYSSREIGQQLMLSDNTVRSKQSRALKKMEAFLDKK